jgi:photosystem II stability/assembly factor-like uncharacterized protein
MIVPRCYQCFLLIFLCIYLLGNTEWVDISFDSPTKHSYVSVTWPYDPLVLIVGSSNADGSKIVASTDYGLTWTNRFVSADVNLVDIASRTFSNGETYYLSVSDGGLVYYATGDGSIWNLNASLPLQPYSVTIGSNYQAFISCFGGVYTTTIPSSSWNEILEFQSLFARIYDISTFDGVNIIAVGTDDQTLYGHRYYKLQTLLDWNTTSPASNQLLFCIAHGSALTAIAAGSDSYVIKTTDGGASWITLSVFSSSDMKVKYHSISFVSINEVFIAGSNQDPLGEIYRTVDGGTSWDRVASSTAQFFSIEMLNSMYGVAGSAPTLCIFTKVSGMIIYPFC